MSSSSRAREHIRSNVVGYLALFLVLAGGTASALPGKNSVDSGDIKNGQVRSADIKNEQVSSADIRDGDVKSVDLGTGSVSAAKISNFSIDSLKLSANAVTAEKIAAGAVTGAAVDESTLDPETLQMRIEAACSSGQAITDVAADGTATCAAVGGGGPGGSAAGDLTGTWPEVYLADGAVDTAAIADGSVTGEDIDPSAYDLSTLQARVTGTCPVGSAVKGVTETGNVTCNPIGDGTGTGGGPPTGEAGGDLAGEYPNPTLAPPGAWRDLAIQPTWTAYEDGFARPQCYLDASGVVHLRGAVRKTATGEASSSPVIMPRACTTDGAEGTEGVRQAFVLAKLDEEAFTDGFSTAYLTPQGRLDVDTNQPAVNSGVSLDGVSFRPTN